MISKYEYLFTFDNEKEKLRLPVLPEKFKVSIGSSNQSVDVSGLGEITIKQDRPAIVFSFSSIFPSVSFPGIEYEDFPDPETCIDTLMTWKDSKYPIHFIITGSSINTFATIEGLDYEEVGGDVGTLRYDITLKEYRAIKVRQVVVNQQTKAAAVSKEKPRVDNRVQPKTYSVVSGDYLFKIAQKTLGNSAKWTEIAKLNNIKAPYTIYPKQSLKLPG